MHPAATIWSPRTTTAPSCKRRVGAEDRGEQLGRHGRLKRLARLEVLVQPGALLHRDDGSRPRAALSRSSASAISSAAAELPGTANQRKTRVCPSRARACRSSGWNTTSAANGA